MSLPSTDFITPAEYLEIERKAEIRSEYIAGRMYAMSGASEPHGMIIWNLSSELHNQMRGRNCRAYIADMRVKVSPTGMYTYPDIAALCGEPSLEDTHLDTLLNPTVIVEVLSPSTEAYDRGEKFAHYRRLESLREYVLVAQNKMRIEHFRREGEEWILSEISEPEGTLHLPAIDCHVALAAIYEKVAFNPPSAT
jgi:Uma2 family endonuclease